MAESLCKCGAWVDDADIPTHPCCGVGGWMPIETAPNDGTHVLLSCCWPDGHPFVCTGWFDVEEDEWYQTNEHWTDAHSAALLPTHWQPLPPPPGEPK